MEIVSSKVVSANVEISAMSEVYKVSGVAVLKENEVGYDYLITEGKVAIGEDVIAHFMKRATSLDVTYVTTDENEQDKASGLINEFVSSVRMWSQGVEFEVK